MFFILLNSDDNDDKYVLAQILPKCFFILLNSGKLVNIKDAYHHPLFYKVMSTQVSPITKWLRCEYLLILSHEDIEELKRYFQVNSESLFFTQAWNKVICPYLCRVVTRRLVLKPETSFAFQSGNNWLDTKKKQDQSISSSQRRGRCDRGGRVVQQANKFPFYKLRRRDGHGLLLLLWTSHSPQVMPMATGSLIKT